MKKKKEVMESVNDVESFPAGIPASCTNCHDLYTKFKYFCMTCKTPCLNCTGRSKCSSSTDTYDFEKYIESLNRKPKSQIKLKTVGTDTCDLESHFDYYKPERTSVIQKSVATDCTDLNLRRLLNRKRSERHTNNNGKPSSDVDCKYAWKSDLSSHSVCNAEKKDCERGEEKPNVRLKSDENKENYVLVKNEEIEIAFDESSSDESDIDLVTSSKVSKCRSIARNHKLTLLQTVIEAERVFKCCACAKTFPKKYLGVLHLGSHIENNNYICLSCECNFPSLNELTFHFKEVHRGLGTNNIDNILEETGGKICEGDKNANPDGRTCDKNFGSSETDKGFQCLLCMNANDSPCRFPSYKALYLHKRMKHELKESKFMSKIKRTPRLKREFVCLFCGKEFKSNKALSDHLPVHTGEKNYLCDICNKSYTTSANLQIHKRTHMGLKNFKCTLCDKAFHKKDSLKVHFRKHSGERPFQCDLCPMRFDRNFILKNHRLRHFSEKTYICPVCGKGFTTHGGLNNHEKSHKREPGLKKPRKPAVKPTLDTENAVICDVCGKVYSTRSNLRIHKFVHLGVKPFQCPVCHQSYAKKDSMLTHMRKHTDDRPFSCETCGMAFYRNHTLKTHRLRHTGERPHKCHMCGKSFTQSSSLTYHIKHHNKKEEKKKIHFMEGQNKSHKKKKFSGAKGMKIKEAPKCDMMERTPEILNEMVVISDENGQTTPLMVPVIKKEVLVLNENITVDGLKKDGKQSGLYEVDKDNGQFPLNKYNYYIAKNHAMSPPKDSYKSKVTYYKEDEKEGEAGGENLILPKNNCLTKDGNLLLSRELWSKAGKGDFSEMEENRTDVKSESVLPIAGEILNATFISDENGEVVPFGSMTLQGVTADNIMISPLIKVESSDESDRRKSAARGSRVTVIDPKMKYNPASTGKTIGKANCQIVNVKDSRMQQRIQLINSDTLSFHIQVPVSAVADDGVLSGITPPSTYYGSV